MKKKTSSNPLVPVGLPEATVDITVVENCLETLSKQKSGAAVETSVSYLYSWIHDLNKKQLGALLGCRAVNTLTRHLGLVTG